MPAHARGEGREVRERERQKRQKSLQINGIVLAAPGVGMEWGRGPFPGGARRWEVARTKRNTTPKWAPDAPKPPSRSHPPDTRERHGPPPHSDNPKRHSLPSHGQTYSPWNPHGRDGPPSQRSLTRRCLPKRLSHGQHKPSQHQDSPHPGKKWLQGASLRREWYPRAPRRKDNSERCSALFQVLQDRHPHRRDGGGPETSLPGSFRDSFSLEREPAQD